jgi:hypothetical protein
MKNPPVMLRVSPASLYPSLGTMDGKFLDPSEESNPWNEAAFLHNEPAGAEIGASMLMTNESGLYSLILRSKRPEAKKFKKWITSEVLPSIRKTGNMVAELRRLFGATTTTGTE